MKPGIAHAELFSYLVTRHTGRTVRVDIERRLAEFDRAALAVLDLHHVPLIDFSCADEVVAKLVVLTAGSHPHPRYVLFRGVAERHLGPIESALARQGLVAAAEGADGEPLLMGSLAPDAAAAWREVWLLGYVRPDRLAERLEVTLAVASALLEELVVRALVFRDDEAYLSLGRVLSLARPEDGLGGGASWVVDRR